MAQNTPITQLDQANAVLRELSPNVSTNDRVAAQEELELSRITISIYLKGEGKNLDTALSLIKFFRKLIGDRAKYLSPSL